MSSHSEKVHGCVNLTAVSRQVGRCVVIIAAVLCGAEPVPALQPGDAAPAFSVYAGSRRFSYPESFSGTVLVVTHEAKDVVEKNRPFKNRVRALCASPENASGAVLTLPVIDCSGYVGLIQNYCAAKVEEHARKENLQLYTDRDGRMRRDYGMREHESNIVIIDRQGVVRYHYTGALPDKECTRIMELISQLLGH